MSRAVTATYADGKRWVVVVKTAGGWIHAQARTEDAAADMAKGVADQSITEAQIRGATRIPWEIRA